MTKEEMAAAIKSISDKAVNADNSNDALKFSQAATNLANAFCALRNAESVG